jgi:ligand-binding SRPBCC domain-containing protein
MLHLNLKTTVKESHQKVFQLFTRELFIKLSPPFPKVKLLRFDGSEKQDKISVELDFFFFKQTWNGIITEKKTSKGEIYFIDEGIQLPFFLKKWKHKHRLIQNGENTDIVDDVSFESPIPLLDFLLYPVMYLQFAYRKPIYKKIFGDPEQK